MKKLTALDVPSERSPLAAVAEQTGESPLVKAMLIPASKGAVKGQNGLATGYQARLAAGREPRKAMAQYRTL